MASDQVKSAIDAMIAHQHLVIACEELRNAETRAQAAGLVRMQRRCERERERIMQCIRDLIETVVAYGETQKTKR